MHWYLDTTHAAQERGCISASKGMVSYESMLILLLAEILRQCEGHTGRV